MVDAGNRSGGALCSRRRPSSDCQAGHRLKCTTPVDDFVEHRLSPIFQIDPL
jgi:hypothetical protein